MYRVASIRSGIEENMEDRYLFKAKDCNSIWRAGLLIALQEGRCAIEEKDGSKWACDSETLCQCTGLKDKNGKLIYEGDIVKCLYNSYGENGVYIGKVIYREDTCCFVDANSESTDYEWWEEEKEVIGNIFDNKELLESEE